MPSRSDLAENPTGNRFALTTGRKRFLMIGLMGLAGLAFILAVLVSALGVEDAATWLIVCLAVLVVALAGELVLLVWGDSREFDARGEWYDWEKEAKQASAKEVVLRCTGCNKTFPVKDTGERPLRTSCVHCGKTGVLKAPSPVRK